VLPALSPLVTCSSVGRMVGSFHRFCPMRCVGSG
jgi:hypothetical protein